jgi:hypothetical protein
VRPIDKPPPPSEAWKEPELSDAEPKRLGGATLEANPAKQCTEPNKIPEEAEYQQALSALAAESATDGVFQVELLANGCARLIEWRKGGEVQRWELRRRVADDEWQRFIQWDFDPGVKRPSTVHRFALTTPLDRFGEWEKDEVHRKRFVFTTLPAREETFVHYRGENALFTGTQRISSNVPTSSCRRDGSNHCDHLERDAWWRFSNPY